ncbi:MAG: hypothetical protein LBH32_06830 [Dysgonamonadaceae bacterium]|jgi:hypothetical protein|nr:hypothetical protein [Dysgonamonadaceae bacterium]
MPQKDLHSKPFDKGTITKLEIFENYAKEWLPTFVMSSSVKEIWIQFLRVRWVTCFIINGLQKKLRE